MGGEAIIRLAISRSNLGSPEDSKLGSSISVDVEVVAIIAASKSPSIFSSFPMITLGSFVISMASVEDVGEGELSSSALTFDATRKTVSLCFLDKL
jgi:hypothetical protein